MDVKVEFDKHFEFKSVRTWNPPGPGEVKMARTQEDDPETARRKAEGAGDPRGGDGDVRPAGLAQTTAEPALEVT